MTRNHIKILFFADSHLGFDFPIHPRVQRRRRGDDFFNNYQNILDIAVEERVDLVVHGGDLFFRSIIPPLVVEKAFEPLVKVANTGIPIYLVPGNHERSKFPGHLWLAHEKIHVFDKPHTYFQKIGRTVVSLSGFPFTRKVKQHFQDILQRTNYRENPADIRFLCMHQTIEGAQVGPSDFTFRVGPDNIPGSDIPGGFSAVLSGHIHRSQLLTHTLHHQPMLAPVIYPGSIERTSFAERNEEKHYVIIKIDPSSRDPAPIIEFHPLPARPMVKVEIPTSGMGNEALKKLIRGKLFSLDTDSIVRIQLSGSNAEDLQRSITAGDLRTLAPPSMNVSLGYRWRNRNRNIADQDRVHQSNPVLVP